MVAGGCYRKDEEIGQDAVKRNGFCALMAGQPAQFDIATQRWSDLPVFDQGKNASVEVSEAAYAYDKDTNALFYFGGVNALGVLGGLNMLVPRYSAPNPKTNKTTLIGLDKYAVSTAGDVPEAVRGAAMVIFNKQLLLHGGVKSSGHYSSEMFVLDLEGPRSMIWRKLTFSITPSGRFGHSLSLIPPPAGTSEINMVLIGGADDASLADVWIFSGLNPEWKWTRASPLPAPGAAEPVARFAHSAVVIGKKIIVYGGCDAVRGSCYSHVQALDTDTWQWLPVPGSLAGSRLPAHAVPINAAEAGADAVSSSFRSHPARGGASAVILPAVPGSHYPATRIALTFGCGDLACSPRDTVRQISILDVDAVCPNSCAAGRGRYVEESGGGIDAASEELAYSGAHCVCKAGNFGRFCERTHKCPGGCSGKGECVIEARDGMTLRYCKCRDGFWGVDCSLPPCPHHCSGRGVCKPGPNPVFLSGAIASLSARAALAHDRNLLQLPANVSQDIKIPQWLSLGPNRVRKGRNIIQNEATGGYTPAEHKSLLSFATASQYAAGGALAASHCECRRGFTGPDCSLVQSGAAKIRCANDCSGHGLCDSQGQCACAAGFSGPDCNIQCPSLCSGNGLCTGDGKCLCNKGFRGRDCSKKWCADRCSHHGTCTDGVCKCDKGWGGRFCEISTDCSGNGRYVDGACVCTPGWGNAQCSQRIYCPQSCSGNGECVMLPSMGVVSQLLQRPVSAVLFPGEPDAPPASLALGLLELSAEASVSAEIEGVCKCKPGWRGADCSRKTCEKDCKHGFCNDDGQCQCYPGYQGVDCRELVSCLNNCTGTAMGRCSTGGKCTCEPGWGGEDCSTPLCPAGCSGNGECVNGYCTCKPGFGGADCSLECPARCSGQGDCIDGKCRCAPGFAGRACSKPAHCPRNQFIHPHLDCSGHGFCFRPGRKCICEPGYTGKDCSQDDGSCGAGSCGNHGTCRHGQCICDLGWSGSHCEFQNQCPANCNKRGFCVNGECHCYTGFEGSACEKLTEDKTCPKNCSNRGLCKDGKCLCVEGAAGEDCSEVTGFCKNNTCSGRGQCFFGKCYCEPGSHGKNCERVGCEKCEEGKGVCVQGRCHCLPGFTGEDCSRELTCPGNGCSGRGVCTLGTCACMPGYTGRDCSKLIDDNKLCKNDCSGKGVCHLGKCFCIDGYMGDDCSKLILSSCPNDCGGKPPTFDQRGDCLFGRCYCKMGYAGEGCETELRCPTKCGEFGICMGGACFCSPGYSGFDCQTPLNSTVRDALFAADISPLGAVSLLQQAENSPTATIVTVFPSAEKQASSRAASRVHAASLTPTLAAAAAAATAAAPAWVDAETADEEPMANSYFIELENTISAKASLLQPDVAASAAETNADAAEPEDIARRVIEVASEDAAMSLSPEEISFLTKSAAATSVSGSAEGDANAATATAATTTVTNDASNKSSGRAACGGAAQGCIHGICVNNQCMCSSGYAGPNCNTTLVANEWKRCPDGCSNHGTCILGRCVCDLGFAGANCSRRQGLPCPRDCSGHGLCHHGKCFCEPGFSGVACALVISCPQSCGSNGVCFRGQCVCAKGFVGATCQTRLSDDQVPASIIATEDDFALLRFTNPSLEDSSKLADIIGPPGVSQSLPAPKPISDDAEIAAGARKSAAQRAKEEAERKAKLEAEQAAFAAKHQGASLIETSADVVADQDAFACPDGCGMNGRCFSGRCYCAPGYGGVTCNKVIEASLAEIEASLDALAAEAFETSSTSASTAASSSTSSSTTLENPVIPKVALTSGGWTIPPLLLVLISFSMGMLLQGFARRALRGRATGLQSSSHSGKTM